MNKLQKDYHDAVMAYIKAFEAKQELEFYGWVGGNLGEVAVFSDMYIDFCDIVLDIDSQQPKGLIAEWYETINSEKSGNYRSYCMGYRNLD
jgi:hypothetical protein